MKQQITLEDLNRLSDKGKEKSLDSILGECKCSAGYGAPWIWFRALNCPVHNTNSV